MTTHSYHSAHPHGARVHKIAAARAIAGAALVAGTLDALAAVAVFVVILGQTDIVGVLQLIASGAYGERAFSMGLAGAFIGVGFHYFIAVGCSVAVYALYKRMPIFRDYPILSGLAFGGYVWVFMNFLVLPLSNVAQTPFSPGVALTGFAWHMVLVGVPIVLIIRRHFGGSRYEPRPGL